MKIQDQSGVDDMQVNVSLVNKEEVGDHKGKVCILYGTTMTSDGITTRTFENTTPPAIRTETSPSKVDVGKERNFDKNDCPDALYRSKFARKTSPLKQKRREKKVGTKTFLKNKTCENRGSSTCHLYNFAQNL